VLKAIDRAGTHDFVYVGLIDDKCTHAANRVDEFNLYGFPTTYFDGGLRVGLGGYSDTTWQQNWFEAVIDTCGARPVNDLDVTVTVDWVGDAAMDIDVAVTNNEATGYSGRIRVYVTETVSSMGWNDSWSPPRPYTYTFLDYAFNEDIAIGAGGTWNGSTTWVGYDHNDGHGNDFGIITPNNVTVVAAVFDDTWHQGYSYPPSGYPFDAYYVDEAAKATPTISELVVDDEHNQFMIFKGEEWNTVNYPDANAGSTHYISGSGKLGDNIVAWRVDQIITPGTYDVYAWKFDHPWSSQMATDAQFIVKDKYGIAGLVTVDQSTAGDEWISLGSYEFSNTGVQGVGISDDANGIVAADAIKFVYTGP
jgi:hypothetical protein